MSGDWEDVVIYAAGWLAAFAVLCLGAILGAATFSIVASLV